MTVYKRTVFELIRGVVSALFAGLAVGLVLSFIVKPMVIALLPGAAVLLVLCYMAIFKENIRFELEGSQLRYYQNGMLKHTFALENCTTYCRFKTESSLLMVHDIDLYITDVSADPETKVPIDCSPIGKFQFAQLYKQIQQYSPETVPKLETTKKDLFL